MFFKGQVYVCFHHEQMREAYEKHSSQVTVTPNNHIWQKSCITKGEWQQKQQVNITYYNMWRLVIFKQTKYRPPPIWLVKAFFFSLGLTCYISTIS